MAYTGVPGHHSAGTRRTDDPEHGTRVTGDNIDQPVEPTEKLVVGSEPPIEPPVDQPVEPPVDPGPPVTPSYTGAIGFRCRLQKFTLSLRLSNFFTHFNFVSFISLIRKKSSNFSDLFSK